MNEDITVPDVEVDIPDYPDWWNEGPEDVNINDCYFIYIPEDDYFLRVEYNNGWLYLYESRT